jgi:hypothetical protein
MGKNKLRPETVSEVTQQKQYGIPDFDAPDEYALLTPGFMTRMRLALSRGHSQRAAAQYAGITPAVLVKWLEHGRYQAEQGIVTPHTILVEQFEQGKLECDTILEASSFGAALKDGRHALDILSRRNPEDWGRKDSAHTTATVDITLELKRLLGTPDQKNEIYIGPDKRAYIESSARRSEPGLPHPHARQTGTPHPAHLDKRKRLRSLSGNERRAAGAAGGAQSRPRTTATDQEGRVLDIE